MAKKMRRFLVIVIALALCASQIVLPAMAAGTTETTESVTDPVTGLTTTTTTENSAWEDKSSEGADVSGQEIKVSVTVTDDVGNVIQTSGNVEGQEQTDLTTTDTDSSTTEGVVVDEQTSTDSTTETIPAATEVTEGQWIEGDTTEGQWELGEDIQEGTLDEGTTEQAPTSSESVDISDPLDNKDVTLELKPGSSDTHTETVDVEGLVEIPEVGTKETEVTDASGKVIGTKVTVTEEVKDADGKVIGYKVTTTTTTSQEESEDGYDVKDTVEEDESGYEVGEAATSTPVLPEGTEAGEKELLDESGKVIGSVVTEIEEVKDESGNIIGYKITKTTTENATGSSTTASTEADKVETGEAVITVTLPAKPASGETVDEATGEKTTVTVNELYSTDGILIGYETVTVKTDAEGKELSRETEKVYGTTETQTTTTTDYTNIETTIDTEKVTVENEEISATTTEREVELTTERDVDIKTTVVTQTDIYQLVETEDGVFFLYKGEMYPVVAQSGHGDITMTSADVNTGLTPKGKDGTVSSDTLLRNPENFTVTTERKDGYDYQYVGYGLETAVRVNKDYEYYGENGWNDVLVHQFVLEDAEGNKQYVLCADLGTSAIRGTSYNMANIEVAEYFKTEGAAEKIEAIALSGYWGTDSGVGSLESVKQLLRDAKKAGTISISDSYIENLTPGEALTATQAAIWYYASSNEQINDEAITGKVLQSNGYTRNATAEEAITVNALYGVLIGLNPDEVHSNTTTFITEKNFANEASITVQEKTVDNGGENDVYKASIGFTMAVVPTANDDLIVRIYSTVDGKPGELIATKRLAGDDSKTGYGTISSQDGKYTINDLELVEGVTITLNLEGTQYLNEGVYLYTADVYTESQTFVGIASGTRDVDLSVDMKFEVTEPTVQLAHSGEKKTQTRDDLRTDSRTDVRTDSKTTVSSLASGSKSVTSKTNTKVYADVTLTTLATTNTLTERAWASSWLTDYEVEYDPAPNDDDFGWDDEDDGDEDEDDEDEEDTEDTDDTGDNGGNEEQNHNDNTNDDNVKTYDGGLTVIEDEEVALAAAPKTGDISGMWAIASLISIGGVFFLNRKREGEEN